MADLERAGAPQEVIDGLREQAAIDQAARKDRDDFEVWPDCWEALLFFISLSDQWSYVSGMTTRRTGLPASEILAEMKLQGIRRKHRMQLRADMRDMAEAVLQADNELRKKEET